MMATASLRPVFGPCILHSLLRIFTNLFIYCININFTHFHEQYSLYLPKIGPIYEYLCHSIYCQNSERSFAKIYLVSHRTQYDSSILDKGLGPGIKNELYQSKTVSITKANEHIILLKSRESNHEMFLGGLYIPPQGSSTNKNSSYFKMFILRLENMQRAIQI